MTAIAPYNNFNLRNFNTFKIDSYAKYVYFPSNIEEFIELANTIDNYIILGGGSNVILSSLGIDIPVILTTRMDKIEIENNILTLGAGVKGAYISRICEEKSLTGFEFLAPIPCTIGGAVYMNASAHNQSIAETFLSATLWDKKAKKIITFNKEDMCFSYRNSILKNNNYVLLESKFELKTDNRDEIKNRIENILEKRKYTQPSLKNPNAGSIFKNPIGNSAGKLIEQAALKGTIIGGAKISDMHGNFILNKNFAKSEDILELMFLAYNKINKEFNIKLEPEVIFIGKKSKKEEEIWEILQNKAG